MTDWTTEELPDALDFREGPGILARDFRESGVPLIRLAGLKRGASLLEGCNHLDPDAVARKWSHFQVRTGDVLLSTSASLGEVATVTDDGVGGVPYTGIIRFRPKDDRIVPSFIPHLLTAPAFAQQIAAMGVGSVMKHFGPSHLKYMRVSYPPVPEQRGIAEVLGALDDKIAANRCVMDTADQMIDALFSAREHQLGEETFADIADIGGGGTPKTKFEEYWGGDIQWATPTDVTGLNGLWLNSTARTITDHGLMNCSSRVYPRNSILMTSRATIGAFALAARPMAVNQGFIVVNARDSACQWWLYAQMRARVPEFLSHANGATFMELSRGRFKSLPVWIAEDWEMKEFGVAVAPLLDRVRASQAENERLGATRDALLPLLMSGRVRVKDIEDEVGELV